MKLSNCFIFAVLLWLRRARKGKRAYVTGRLSDMGRFPHFLYEELRRGERRIVSYKPIAPKRRILPPLLFKGRVAWGDDAHPPLEL
jgi:hypothetical protein